MQNASILSNNADVSPLKGLNQPDAGVSSRERGHLKRNKAVTAAFGGRFSCFRLD